MVSVNHPLPTVGSGGTPAATPTNSGGSGAGYVVKTTRPKEHLRHDISDEELQVLINAERGGIVEAMWCFFGIALGLLPNVWGALHTAYFKVEKTPLAGEDMGQIGIFFLAIGICVALFFNNIGRGNRARKLATDIRARKKS